MTIGYGLGPGGLYRLLSKGPDLYRTSVDYDFTPHEESPTSLSMYSSWAFQDWRDGLDSIEADFEEFVEQELKRNHAVHAGWEKETLLDLFAYDYRPDFELRRSWECSDCSRNIRATRVQPHWRHIIERIKQGLDPDSSTQTGSEVGEEEDANSRSIAEAASESGDLSLQGVSNSSPQTSSEVDEEKEVDSESEAASESGDLSFQDFYELFSESEEDSHGYPASVSIRSDCLYARDEVICMGCWLHYVRYGTGRQPHARIQHSATDADEDSSSEEYSPFLIHS